MAEIQRRSTTASTSGDFGAEHRNRRKSGIFFFNRSFKKSSKGENDGNDSDPTTPTDPSQEGYDLKKSISGRSIPVLAQTSAVTVEAEGLSSSQNSASISLGKAAQRSHSNPALNDAEPKPTEDLPTPPDTPGGPSCADGATSADEAELTPQDSDSPTEVAEVEKKSYHEDADLDIKVRDSNGGDAIYSVRSSVLESASRVWKQSIPEKTSDSIDLVSDPAFGLDVIFSIAHYKFQDLPLKVNAHELYGIAVAAEKYETLHLLVPFVKNWVGSVAASEPAAESQTDKNETLVSGWVLGQPQAVARVIADCAYSSSVDPEGTLLDSEGKPWREQTLSGEVLELLAALRLAAVEQIVQAVSGPVHTLLNPASGTEEAPRYCQAPGDDSVREECEQLQLGSAIMGLTKAKLWPAPEPSTVLVSPAELARTYGEVRLRRSVEDGHAQCGFGHQAHFERILSQPAQLTPAVTQQLVARAKKSGTHEESLFQSLEESSA